ncbi:hypothetical protein FRC07_012279, partial [Ceratobasidium sp. 392]
MSLAQYSDLAPEKTINHMQAAQTCLQQAAANFLNACTTLKTVAYRANLALRANQASLETLLNEVKSNVE